MAITVSAPAFYERPHRSQQQLRQPAAIVTSDNRRRIAGWLPSYELFLSVRHENCTRRTHCGGVWAPARLHRTPIAGDRHHSRRHCPVRTTAPLCRTSTPVPPSQSNVPTADIPAHVGVSRVLQRQFAWSFAFGGYSFAAVKKTRKRKQLTHDVIVAFFSLLISDNIWMRYHFKHCC